MTDKPKTDPLWGDGPVIYRCFCGRPLVGDPTPCGLPDCPGPSSEPSTDSELQDMAVEDRIYLWQGQLPEEKQETVEDLLRDARDEINRIKSESESLTRTELWKDAALKYERWDKSHGTPGAWTDVQVAMEAARAADAEEG